MEVNYTDISKIYDNYRSYPESLIKKVIALGRINEGKKVLAELTIKRQRRGKNGISKFMPNTTLDDMGYPLARSLDCAMERCGFMEGCWQQTLMVVCSSVGAQYIGNTGDNIHFRVQPEEISTRT